MRTLLTTLALLSAATAPAFADNNRVLTSVKITEIRSMLVEEGYTVVSTGDDGADSIRARTEDGIIFNILGTACATAFADGCLGLNMQVRYDADGRETLERINNANLMWAATAIWYSEEGFNGGGPTVGMSRYVILDSGVTAGNIKDNLINLLAIAPQAADYIWQAGRFAPGADPDDWDDEDYFYGDW
ncbi:MAG: YbjN domain-containing protein [Hyphomonas sp.]